MTRTSESGSEGSPSEGMESVMVATKGLWCALSPPPQQAPWKMKAGSSVSLCLGEVFICVGLCGTKAAPGPGESSVEVRGQRGSQEAQASRLTLQPARVTMDHHG